MAQNTTHLTIRAALRQWLLAMSGVDGDDTQISWEGREFTPPDEGKWFRETLKPQTSLLQTLGPQGRIRHEGLYLVDCFALSNPKSFVLKPTVDVDTMAGNVMERFTPNTQITYSGLVVTVRRVARSGNQTTTDTVQVPVTVAWYADSYNSI
jgi:hypothetical protein